jgi:integrase
MAVSLVRQSNLACGVVTKLVSAITTVARIVAPGMPKDVALARLRLEVSALNAVFQQARRRGELSTERLASLRSEVGRVMRLLGLVEPSRRGQLPASPIWRQLLERLPERSRWALIDFLRFADELGIAPAEIDASTLRAFHLRCREKVLCRNPDVRAYKVAAAWNQAVRNVPGWPGTVLDATPRQNAYTLRWAAYPASLQEDLERYKAMLAGDHSDYLMGEEIFAERSTSKPHRRGRRLATIRLKERVLREAAAGLVHARLPPAEIRLLRDLVQPIDRVETILRFHLDRDRANSTNNAWRVAEELRLVARDYCGSSSSEVEKIANWAKRIRPRKEAGMTEKNARRVRALLQPRTYALLLHLPRELMRRAHELMKPPHEAPNPQAAARLAMYAVALEILLVCPLRRKNLAELRIADNLHRPDPRKARISHLVVSAREVKNGNPVHWPLLRDSGRLIETFISRFRPVLAQSQNDFLFPGRGSEPRNAQQMATWLAKTVSREVRAEFNVHLARHFTAACFLRHHPGQYEMVRRLLGHKNIATTIAAYVGLEVDAAVQRHDSIVLQDRQKLRPVADKEFRRKARTRAAKTLKQAAEPACHA